MWLWKDSRIFLKLFFKGYITNILGYKLRNLGTDKILDLGRLQGDIFTQKHELFRDGTFAWGPKLPFSMTWVPVSCDWYMHAMPTFSVV